MNMWKKFKGAASHLVDRFSERTKLAAVRVPLERASRKRQVTLDVPGYLQINSFGCSAVGAAMIVRFFHPATTFGRVWEAIDPDPHLGAGRTKVKNGLRACAIHVASRRRLDFRDLCHAIDKGCPILVSIYNPGADAGHWVVVYGYGKRPDRVFLAGNSLPWIGKNQISRRQFEGLWYPDGNGLVCRTTALAVAPQARPASWRRDGANHRRR
jgi:hypothetical protein